MENLVIFCDFDGTITNNDNIISLMAEFAPEGWETIKDGILSQEVTIEKGIKELFSLLPVGLKQDIISFVLKDGIIREGFKDFVQFTRDQNIPLYIVSGGIDFFVHPVLEPFGPFDHIYCNEADFSGETIEIIYPHKCDDACASQGCGCCKPSIIRKLADDKQTRIVIGDSITDFQAAKLADVVIARDFLVEKCKELDIPHKEFESFHDVIEIIKTLNK